MLDAELGEELTGDPVFAPLRMITRDALDEATASCWRRAAFSIARDARGMSDARRQANRADMRVRIVGISISQRGSVARQQRVTGFSRGTGPGHGQGPAGQDDHLPQSILLAFCFTPLQIR